MDEYTDAWFIGFDPNITVGVWVGYDEKKPLGNGETGAQAALPIWMDFMKAYIDKHGDRKNPPQFEAPGNIVFVTLGTGDHRGVHQRHAASHSQHQPHLPPAQRANPVPAFGPGPLIRATSPASPPTGTRALRLSTGSGLEWLPPPAT